MRRLQVKLQHLKELGDITYQQFQVQLIDLNDLCRKHLAGQAAQLEFAVQPLPPHSPNLFWKALVRVECRKLSCPGGQLVSVRLLSLRQMLALMRDLRAFSRLSDSAAAAATAGAGSSAAQSALITADFTASSVLGMVLPESGDEAASTGRRSSNGRLSSSSDIEECCICMDRQAEILLACAHAYCQLCIDAWLHGSSHGGAAAAANNRGSKTCPICRSHVTSDSEGWVITAPSEDVGAASLMLDAAARAGSAMEPE